MILLCLTRSNFFQAMCTILSVVGILSFCTFPFIVTSLYDATHGEGRNLPEDRSEIADWMLSIVTILLLCTYVQLCSTYFYLS